jgi:hypothetical protein
LRNITSYKSNFIEIDLLKNQYKLELGKDWRNLPEIKSISIAQVNMKQSGGGRGGTRSTHKYKAYCVYIKSQNSHLMVFRGNNEDALIEKRKLSALFNKNNVDFINQNRSTIEEKAEVKRRNNVKLGKILLIICLITLPLIILLRLVFAP